MSKVNYKHLWSWTFCGLRKSTAETANVNVNVRNAVIENSLESKERENRMNWTLAKNSSRESNSIQTILAVKTVFAVCKSEKKITFFLSFLLTLKWLNRVFFCLPRILWLLFCPALRKRWNRPHNWLWRKQILSLLTSSLCSMYGLNHSVSSFANQRDPELLIRLLICRLSILGEAINVPLPKPRKTTDIKFLDISVIPHEVRSHFQMIMGHHREGAPGDLIWGLLHIQNMSRLTSWTAQPGVG